MLCHSQYSALVLLLAAAAAHAEVLAPTPTRHAPPAPAGPAPALPIHLLPLPTLEPSMLFVQRGKVTWIEGMPIAPPASPPPPPEEVRAAPPSAAPMGCARPRPAAVQLPMGATQRVGDHAVVMRARASAALKIRAAAPPSAAPYDSDMVVVPRTPEQQRVVITGVRRFAPVDLSTGPMGKARTPAHMAVAPPASPSPAPAGSVIRTRPDPHAQAVAPPASPPPPPSSHVHATRQPRALVRVRCPAQNASTVTSTPAPRPMLLVANMAAQPQVSRP